MSDKKDIQPTPMEDLQTFLGLLNELPGSKHQRDFAECLFMAAAKIAVQKGASEMALRSLLNSAVIFEKKEVA